MPADAAIRDRLKAVRADLDRARDEHAAAKREQDAARNAFGGASHPDVKITEWPEFQAAEQAVKKVGDLADTINDLRGAEQSILRLLGERVEREGPGAVNGDGGSITGGEWNAKKVLGADTPYADAVKKGVFRGQEHVGTLWLGEVADREHAGQYLSELPGAPPGPVTTPTVAPLIQPDRRGMLPWQLRPLTFLNMIPTGQTNSNSIEYTQLTAIPNTTGPVAEGALKPEVGLTLGEATAPIRTLAGWIKVNKQAMDDAPAVMTMINTLLPYDLRRKVEAQVLNGDGTGQNLTGLLRTSGIGAPPYVAGDNMADAVLRAITTVVLSDGNPNVIAMNPLDWQDLLLMRDDSGGAGLGPYLFGGPASMAAATLWGMTITPTTVMAQGAPLVGDTSGVTLLIREGINVKTSDSDQDDFIRNRVTVLAECRVGLVVWRPSNFAVVDTTP